MDGTRTGTRPARDPPAGGAPVRPRDAAGLAILRTGGAEPEVLIGRRRARASFMPDVYVFPGGGLDRADARVRPASDLDPHYRHVMGVRGSRAKARALAVAAVREAYEEAGLLVGEPGDPGDVEGPAWEAMRASGLAPALGRLVYVGRAITPTFRSMRFDARFFMADARHARGELGGDGELLDLHWIPLSRAGEYRLAPAQAYMLRFIPRLLAAGPGERLPRPRFGKPGNRVRVVEVGFPPGGD